jgi:hypothetical protein
MGPLQRGQGGPNRETRVPLPRLASVRTAVSSRGLLATTMHWLERSPAFLMKRRNLAEPRAIMPWNPGRGSKAGPGARGFNGVGPRTTRPGPILGWLG